MDALLGDFAALAAAMQLRCACWAPDSAADPYGVALGFAMTRSCVGGLTLTLQQRRDVWDACASALESPGLDACAWGPA
jgi:hypothetical protein